MKFFLSIFLTFMTACTQAVLTPNQTIVNLVNNSSKTVEVRIKARFTDINNKSTKGGGVRVTIEPGTTASIDLKDASQRFREKPSEEKGSITEERKTLRKIDAKQLKSVEILKIVGIDTHALNKKDKELFKVFTEQPKSKKKEFGAPVQKEFALTDSFVMTDKDHAVEINIA